MSHEPKSLAADDRVGTRFGEYQIASLIGVGGMGRVYRATAGDGTTVALKLVKEDLARDETFRRRFRREARIAQTVHNDHLVSVCDRVSTMASPTWQRSSSKGLRSTRSSNLRVDSIFPPP